MEHLIDDNDRLEPCPFCGAEAEIIKIDGEIDAVDTGALCVQCTACGASSTLIYPLMDDVTDLLRERWNKRHNAALTGAEGVRVEGTVMQQTED